MSVNGLERWRPIPGFPGYLVSNHGRVHSELSGKCLRPQAAGQGHLRVALRRSSKTHLRGVHQLVLLAFVGPCPPGHEALHWDDDPTNNLLGNLRWGTRSQNRADAVRNERARGGRQSGQALTRSQVRSVKRMLKAKATHTRIAEAFKVSRTTIAKIADGRLWPDVVV